MGMVYYMKKASTRQLIAKHPSIIYIKKWLIICCEDIYKVLMSILFAINFDKVDVNN